MATDRMRAKPTTADQWENVFAQEHSGFAPPGGGMLLEREQNRYLAPLVRSGIKALEAGCGRGRFVLPYARAGAFAIGVDYSPRLAAAVKTTLRTERLKNGSSLAGDLLALPFCEASLDLYSSFGVYEHFRKEQQERLVAEAFRVLKPGGVVYIDVPHFWSPWTPRRCLRYWYRRVRPPRLVWQRNVRRTFLVALAEGAGFQTEASHVLDTWASLELGLSVNHRFIKAMPNPFYLLRPALRRLARVCENKEWLGQTLIYIGRKPAVS